LYWDLTKRSNARKYSTILKIKKAEGGQILVKISNFGRFKLHDGEKLLPKIYGLILAVVFCTGTLLREEMKEYTQI
jgi:hypothetical protein